MTDYNPSPTTTELVTTTHGELVPATSRTMDQNAAFRYLNSLQSKRSRRTQANSLEVVAELLTGSRDIFAIDWGMVRDVHCPRIHEALALKYKPAFANLVLCALRRTLYYAKKLHQMTPDQYSDAVDDLGHIKGDALPAGRAGSAGEIAALFGACENDTIQEGEHKGEIKPAGARDAAMIACMYPGGLRRSEVVGLDLSDYDPESGALTVRHGKGNKARIVYLTNGATRAMSDWISIRGSEPGPLFYPVDKSGNMTPRRINNQAIYNMLVKRCKLAGVTDFSPHDLRRTFVSDLLEAGADIATVAKLAGHASVTTTQRYDKRPEAAKAKAAGLLHVPYHGRKQ